MPSVIFSATRCNVCFFLNNSSSFSKSLLLCSRCELIRYCGKEHQQTDWTIHKDFCKAVRLLNKKFKIEHLLYINGPIITRKDIERAVLFMKSSMRSTLGRDLEYFEEQLLTFPKYCNTCFTHKTYAKYDCDICGVAGYCCIEHKQENFKKHEDICHYLKICENFRHFEDFTMNFDFQYRIDMNSENHLFDVLEKSCANNINLQKLPKNSDEFQPFFIASSYSSVATILYVLNSYYNHTNSVPRSLKIYIVGAEGEVNWFKKDHLRFFFSQLPTLVYIKIDFIGPHIMQSEPIMYNYYTNDWNRRVELEFHRKTFEEFHQKISDKSKESNRPNLIASFNCGFSEFSQSTKNPWRPGIEKILDYKDTPILFTSYTQLEARSDIMEVNKVIKESNISFKVIVDGKENPYKDYTPFRNWEVSDEHDPIYFRNGYFHVIISNYSRN